ncbi:Eukaryotic translation initiation factor 4B [Tyrophagus putrescentiae]|nr:Eukaryotic translation initiation factor 4B [Tyrophagus putrescentiae]
MASVSQPAAPATGKGKGKKSSKGQKLDIDDFVDSSNFKMVAPSWADEMEDEVVIAPSQHHSLPSAPKSALGPEVDLAAIPTIGPFRAHVTNLQYEVTEDQLSDLFKNLNITSLRLHSENGRPNGTANIEFGTRNDLIDALSMSQKMLNGRAVKIYLPNQDRYGMGDGARRGGRGGGGSYTDNTPMNWRAADRTAPPSRGGGDDRYPPKSDRVFPPPTAGFGADRGYGSRGGPRRDGGGGFGGGEGGGEGGGSFRNPRNDFAGGYGGGRDYDRRGGP